VQFLLALRDGDELHLGADQLPGRREEVETVDRGVLYDVDGRTSFHQELVRRPRDPGGPHAEAGGGASLGIEIDEESLVSVEGEGGAEVDGRGRLPHPTLLIGHRDRPTHQPLHREGGAGSLGSTAVYHTGRA